MHAARDAVRTRSAASFNLPLSTREATPTKSEGGRGRVATSEQKREASIQKSRANLSRRPSEETVKAKRVQDEDDDEDEQGEAREDSVLCVRQFESLNKRPHTLRRLHLAAVHSNTNKDAHNVAAEQANKLLSQLLASSRFDVDDKDENNSNQSAESGRAIRDTLAQTSQI